MEYTESVAQLLRARIGEIEAVLESHRRALAALEGQPAESSGDESPALLGKDLGKVQTRRPSRQDRGRGRRASTGQAAKPDTDQAEPQEPGGGRDEVTARPAERAESAPAPTPPKPETPSRVTRRERPEETPAPDSSAASEKRDERPGERPAPDNSAAREKRDERPGETPAPDNSAAREKRDERPEETPAPDNSRASEKRDEHPGERPAPDSSAASEPPGERPPGATAITTARPNSGNREISAEVVLNALRNGHRSAGDIARHFGAPVRIVRQRLRELEDAGRIRRRKR